MPAAHAFKFDTGNEDLKLRWDNTVKYSAAVRVKDPLPGSSPIEMRTMVTAISGKVT